MKKFKPIKSLEDLSKVREGEIIGIGQAVTKTIPALCASNNGEVICAFGNMDNKIIIEYEFPIKNVEGFYPDGSILLNFNKNKIQRYDAWDVAYDVLKKRLINGGIWNK